MHRQLILPLIILHEFARNLSVNELRDIDPAGERHIGKQLRIMFPYRVHPFARIRCIRSFFTSCTRQIPRPPGSNKPTRPRTNRSTPTPRVALDDPKEFTAAREEAHHDGYKSGNWDGRQQGYQEGYQRAIADLIHDAHLRRASPLLISNRGQTIRTSASRDSKENTVGAGTFRVSPPAVKAPGALLSSRPPAISPTDPKLAVAMKATGRAKTLPSARPSRTGPEWKSAMKASGTKIGLAMGLYMSGDLQVNGKYAATVLRDPPCARCRRYGLMDCRVLDPAKEDNLETRLCNHCARAAKRCAS